MTQKDNYYIDLNDEVVRGAIILKEGQLLWPPPPPKEVPVIEKPKDTKLAKAPPKELLPADYFRATLKDALIYTTGLGMDLNRFSNQMSLTFINFMIF
jgi:NAD(P) transhydrogenase